MQVPIFCAYFQLSRYNFQISQAFEGFCQIISSFYFGNTTHGDKVFVSFLFILVDKP